MTAKLASVLFIILLVIPSARAQSASGEAEQKKAREERDQKTFELVDEIIKEAQSLKLPENRVRIDLALAGALWPRDETRARARFQDAVTTLSEFTAALDNGEQDYNDASQLFQLAQQLRQEILQVAASRDPGLALDFFRASRPTAARPDTSPAFEAQLEMRLAVQVAAKDPQQALSLAEDSLKVAMDYETANLLHNLHSQDRVAAQKLLDMVMNRLRTEDFGKSPASVNVAVNLLRTWLESNRAGADQSGKRLIVNPSLMYFDEQTARELSNILIKEVVNAPFAFGASGASRIIDGGGPLRRYPGQAIGILQQLKPLLPDIEKLAPTQIAAFRERVAELDRFNNAQQEPWAKYQELVQNGSVTEMLAALKTVAPEVQTDLLQQAAWKALNQGDQKRAREIVETVSDPRLRRQMTLNLDRQSFNRASEQEKLAEARSLLSRLPSPEERAGILCQLAASAASKGDKAAALQFLAEAYGQAGARAMSYPQLQARLQIASGYEELDASKVAAIVDGVIDQVTDLSTAALVLSGFDIAQVFREGEFIINSGNSLNMIAREAAQRAGSISRKQYDRARLMVERFQRPEMRVMGLIQIAEVALSTDGQ